MMNSSQNPSSPVKVEISTARSLGKKAPDAQRSNFGLDRTVDCSVGKSQLAKRRSPLFAFSSRLRSRNLIDSWIFGEQLFQLTVEFDSF